MLPLRPMKTPKSVDGLDLATDLVALGHRGSKFLPGVGTALLHAQGNAATLAVDLEHHDLGLVAHLNHLTGLTFLLVQSISETWTRPSMPGSISTNAP